MRGVWCVPMAPGKLCRGGGVITVITVLVVLAAASVLASGCSSTSTPVSVSQPPPKSGEITFYLSLPSSATALEEAVTKVSVPGSAQYRHFVSLNSAASQFGATDAQLSAVAQSVSSLGLRFTADPTRLFGRVTGTAKQCRRPWGPRCPRRRPRRRARSSPTACPRTRLVPCSRRAAACCCHRHRSTTLAPRGNRPTPPTSQVAAGTAPTTSGTQPWPLNNGTPLTAGCSSPLLKHRHVYTEQQVRTAYGIDGLRSQAAGTPVITILDLGGGWLPSDLKQAGQCFGLHPARSQAGPG